MNRIRLICTIGIAIVAIGVLAISRRAAAPRVALHGVALGDSIADVKRTLPAAEPNEVIPEEWDAPTAEPPGYVFVTTSWGCVCEISWRGELPISQVERFVAEHTPQAPGPWREFEFTSGSGIAHSRLWKGNRHFEWIYVEPFAPVSGGSGDDIRVSVSYGVQSAGWDDKISNRYWRLKRQ